ncbi:MAG TPA: M14 family zinc carboxypeptidase, partial [Capillimicrobium sp.]
MPSQTLRVALAVSAAALAVPAPAAATTVSAAGERDARCHARIAPPSDRGVARETITVDRRSIVTARVRASSGDWDLGLFGADGRRLGGAAAPGADDLAQAFAGAGTTVLVQACRRSGAVRADLTVRAVRVARDGGGKARLARVRLPTLAAGDALDTLGLDVTEHARPGYRDVVLHEAADARALRRAGLRFELQTRTAAARATPRAPGDPLPSGRASYRQLADYEADLKQLADDHPAAVRTLTLPERTLVGRHVQGVEIARDVHAADGRPVMLIMGLHHAREWPSGEVTMEWAIDLAEALEAGDPRVSDLLSRARVLVVPVVNPDGYFLSRSGGDFDLKRKNCRVTDGLLPAPGTCEDPANARLGVDPNRNYGLGWGGPGAFLDPAHDAYRGAGPFSEPESRNLRALVSGRQVVTAISNHTYSDLMLRPPSLRAQGDAPDEPVLKQLGDAMAAQAGAVSQHAWELYDTSGSFDDWAYWATGALAYTPEIGPNPGNTSGFHPAFANVVGFYHGAPGRGGMREAFMLALESTADTARHSVVTGTAPAGATIELSKTFASETAEVLDAQGRQGAVQRFTDALRTTLTVPASGAFAAHANPSTRPAARAIPGRDPDGPLPPAVPIASTGDTVSGGDDGPSQPQSYRDYPFSIGPGDDAARAQVRISWPDPANDFDLYVFREAGATDVLLGSSTTTEPFEQVELLPATANGKLQPGSLYARVVDWQSTDKSFSGAVTFSAPRATVPQRTEAWTVRCLAPWGQ